MTETGNGIECKMRIRNSGNSKTYWRSIGQSPYIWHRDMLIAEGRDSTLVKIHVRKYVQNVRKSVSQKGFKVAWVMILVGQKPRYSGLQIMMVPSEVFYDVWSTDSSEIMYSSIFILLPVKSILYVATSHSKCTICMDIGNSPPLGSLCGLTKFDVL